MNDKKKGVKMFKAYGNFWKKYVDFEGKASLSDYWFVELVNIIIYAMLFSIALIPLLFTYLEEHQYNSGWWYAPYYFMIIVFFISFLYALATFIPTLSIVVRRLRDGGFPWQFIFFYLIPWVGGFIIFVFMLMPSVKKSKKRKS